MHVCFIQPISIHALREEGDPRLFPISRHTKISIHALREEGDQWAKKVRLVFVISIHALREEGDRNPISTVGGFKQFLSTPSARRATLGVTASWEPTQISIHALREEGDPCPLQSRRQTADFYPRPPRGGRRGVPFSRVRGQEFLSTPSARRATMRCTICHRGRVYFYPRPPRGGRRLSAWLPCCCSTISIHALREEGDQVPAPVLYSSCIFLSTPSARRATKPGTS